MPLQDEPERLEEILSAIHEGSELLQWGSKLKKKILTRLSMSTFDEVLEQLEAYPDQEDFVVKHLTAKAILYKGTCLLNLGEYTRAKTALNVGVLMAEELLPEMENGIENETPGLNYPSLYYTSAWTLSSAYYRLSQPALCENDKEVQKKMLQKAVRALEVPLTVYDYGPEQTYKLCNTIAQFYVDLGEIEKADSYKKRAGAAKLLIDAMKEEQEKVEQNPTESSGEENSQKEEERPTDLLSVTLYTLDDAKRIFIEKDSEPDKVELWLVLGLLDSVEEGITELSKDLTLNNDGLAFARGEAEYFRGRSYQIMKNNAQANEHYGKARQILSEIVDKFLASVREEGPNSPDNHLYLRSSKVLVTTYVELSLLALDPAEKMEKLENARECLETPLELYPHAEEVQGLYKLRATLDKLIKLTPIITCEDYDKPEDKPKEETK